MFLRRRRVTTQKRQRAAKAEKGIVWYLARNETIGPEDVQELIGVNEVQASHVLRTARENGVLTRATEHKTSRGVRYRRGQSFDEAAARHGIQLPAEIAIHR